MKASEFLLSFFTLQTSYNLGIFLVHNTTTWRKKSRGSKGLTQQSVQRVVSRVVLVVVTEIDERRNQKKIWCLLVEENLRIKYCLTAREFQISQHLRGRAVFVICHHSTVQISHSLASGAPLAQIVRYSTKLARGLEIFQHTRVNPIHCTDPAPTSISSYTL
jgi:hypothetical protein